MNNSTKTNSHINQKYEKILKQCSIYITEDELVLFSTSFFKNNQEKYDVININTNILKT
jgi:hypothetical protein